MRALTVVAAAENTPTIEAHVVEVVSTVPIARLSTGDSPRLNGTDTEHVRRLAEVDDPLPPILVHRPTMRVIDGMHRLRAAERRGATTISVIFAGCPSNELFLAAVKANIAHGLPLSLADRKAAAARILASHRNWSDRAVAAATGLAHKTVGKIRRDLPPVTDRAERIGRDGHVRPLGSARRESAEEIIARNPEASLRQIARSAGISVSTAHAMRRKMALADPKSSEVNMVEDTAVGLDRRPTRQEHASSSTLSSGQSIAVLQKLMADPSLRFTDSGRALLRLLGTHILSDDEWCQLGDTVPAHWASGVAGLAREQATMWLRFATQLEGATPDAVLT